MPSLLRALSTIRRELAIAAHLIFAVIFLVLLTSFLVPLDAVESGRLCLTPICSSQTSQGQPCVFCGMTRSFLAMSDGQVRLAARYNRLGPWLYGLCWLCLLLEIGFLWRKRCGGRRGYPAID